MNKKEPLDFCRVKKINEKGFGFLKSLYYDNEVFFHFSQIKKEACLDKLNKMKRGDFFLFFTSRQVAPGKRKADKIWYSLKDVPNDILPDFSSAIAEQFNKGSYHLYDLLFALAELKSANSLPSEQLVKILSSSKVLNLPTTIIPYLNPDEIYKLKSFLNFDKIESSLNKPYWYNEFIELEKLKNT